VSNQNTTLLETQNLNKTFGAVTAADNINVKVNHGEIVGIIGANGAGKTTFVNMVTGYLKPTSGKVFLRGRDVTSLAPRQITQLGMSRSHHSQALSYRRIPGSGDEHPAPGHSQAARHRHGNGCRS